jgi:regulator of RNase E activity RraA
VKEPLPPRVIEGLRGADTPTVSNAIEAFNVRDRTEGYSSMELRCQFPDLGPMVGYAVTCTQDSTTPGLREKTRTNEFLDVLAAAPKPTVVVIQDVGTDPSRSCFAGDMIIAAYQKLGATGLVTDGGIRDVTGIRRQAPGFQVFAPGAVASHGSSAKIDIGVPVSVGGLSIGPGDLLHGDESGLVKVPLDIAEAVVEQGELVKAAEAELFEFLRGRTPSLEEIKAKIGGADIARKPPRR